MGFFSGGSANQTIKPYKPVREPLEDLIGRISGFGDDPWELFAGEEVAGFTPQQMEALQRMGAFGGPGGTGADIAGQVTGAGEDALGGLGTGMAALERGLERDPVQASRADLGYAESIADNPFMDEMIQASLRDVTRSFSEGTMPGIAADAAHVGQLGSSRRGAFEAIEKSRSMDRGADIAAGLRGGAYQTGLGMAEGAAGRQTAADLAGRDEEIRRAAGLMEGGGAGAGLLGTGFDMSRVNIEDLLRSGNITQAQEQAVINSLMGRHYLEQELPYKQAGAEMDLLMKPGQAFTTTSMAEGGSPFEKVAGMGAMLAGAALTGGASTAAGGAASAGSGMFGGFFGPGGGGSFMNPGNWGGANVMTGGASNNYLTNAMSVFGQPGQQPGPRPATRWGG